MSQKSRHLNEPIQSHQLGQLILIVNIFRHSSFSMKSFQQLDKNVLFVYLIYLRSTRLIYLCTINAFYHFINDLCRVYIRCSNAQFTGVYYHFRQIIPLPNIFSTSNIFHQILFYVIVITNRFKLTNHRKSSSTRMKQLCDGSRFSMVI